MIGFSPMTSMERSAFPTELRILVHRSKLPGFGLVPDQAF
jgi:hypothetical protein